MELAPGSKLGHYEVLSLLGAGGMGEVYRARDTRLGRTVAIKVLPSHFSTEPTRRQRFEREAKALSSLNHPHICALYDIGREGETDFLVMEFLEGATLAARLEKGPLPTEQILKFAIEISDALNQAHRRSVTHRDLKPANIMLTDSGAKLFDFGLAKPALRADSALTAAVTQGEPLTAEGWIVGTFQYMSPEQMEGKEADPRSDIFAFGAVLYEMVAGKKAFEGKTTASVIAAVLEHQPTPIAALRPSVPPALEWALRKCLAKSPDERWQSAKDLCDELQWILESGSREGAAAGVTVPEERPRRLLRAWTIIATTMALGLAIFVASLFVRQQKKGSIRFQVLPPENATFPLIPDMSLSPDGRRLAFAAHTSDDRDLLFVRSLDALSAQPLQGTEDAQLPFWSPDGRYLGFFAGGKLKKIEISAGQVTNVCDAPNALGATWNRAGIIVFTPKSGGPLYRVSDTGGSPTALTTLDASRHDLENDWPQFLPDGRHFIYLANSSALRDRWISVGSLDSKETMHLVNVNSNGLYAPPGYLLYIRAGSLVAQPFNAKRMQLTGDAFMVAEHVGGLGFAGLGSFSVSEGGVLAYGSGNLDTSELRWIDRNGTRHEAVSRVGDYSNPALSPDGDKLAVGVLDPQTKTRDIWVYDLKRGTASRLTFDPADDLNPVWSADGKDILFTSDRKGNRDIFEIPANGSGEERLVYQSNGPKSLTDWSSDGKYVLYDEDLELTSVWALPLFGDRRPIPYVKAGYNAEDGQLSPNRRFIAYLSGESGREEVYVQTFPEKRGKWLISSAGGSQPQWRRDGKELFYLAEGKMMGVEVRTDVAQFEAGTPRVLFDAHIRESGRRNQYVASPDGHRFLFAAPVLNTTSAAMTVVVNWTADLPD